MANTCEQLVYGGVELCVVRLLVPAPEVERALPVCSDLQPMVQPVFGSLHIPPFFSVAYCLVVGGDESARFVQPTHAQRSPTDGNQCACCHLVVRWRLSLIPLWRLMF